LPLLDFFFPKFIFWKQGKRIQEHRSECRRLVSKKKSVTLGPMLHISQ
jgi:hypothetical protein